MEPSEIFRLLDIEVEAKVRGYKSSEGDEVFPAPSDIPQVADWENEGGNVETAEHRS